MLKLSPVVVLVFALDLAGCAGGPSRAPKQLVETTGPNTFRYIVTSTMLHPLNSGQGEHARMAWLNNYLSTHGLCPQGYDIVSRAPPRSYGRLRRDEYEGRNIVYIGRCRS
jgi:hypothetical protein